MSMAISLSTVSKTPGWYDLTINIVFILWPLNQERDEPLDFWMHPIFGHNQVHVNSGPAWLGNHHNLNQTGPFPNQDASSNTGMRLRKRTPPVDRQPWPFSSLWHGGPGGLKCGQGQRKSKTRVLHVPPLLPENWNVGVWRKNWS